MTRKEIEKNFRKYTKADFEIAVFESNNEETRVIIKFTNAERAEEFFRNANSAPELREGGLIKRVKFVQEGFMSFFNLVSPNKASLFDLK